MSLNKATLMIVAGANLCVAGVLVMFIFGMSAGTWTMTGALLIIAGENLCSIGVVMRMTANPEVGMTRKHAFLVTIGANLCLAGVFMTMTGIPILYMWTASISLDHGEKMQSFIDAFGTMHGTRSGTTMTPTSAINLLPGILSVAGAGLAFVGIRIKKLSVLSGVIAAIGPVSFIISFLSGGLMYSTDPAPAPLIKTLEMKYGPVNIFYSAGTIFYMWHQIDYMFYIGAAFYTCLAGGVLLTIVGGFSLTRANRHRPLAPRNRQDPPAETKQGIQPPPRFE